MMSDNQLSPLDPLSCKVEAHGPFERKVWKLSVGGVKVPYITGFLLDGENTWSLTLDDRWQIDVPDDQLQVWLPFLVNAMAVSAGYTHFGVDGKKRNPFVTRIIGVDITKEDEHLLPYDDDDIWGFKEDV